MRRKPPKHEFHTERGLNTCTLPGGNSSCCYESISEGLSFHGAAAQHNEWVLQV